MVVCTLLKGGDFVSPLITTLPKMKLKSAIYKTAILYDLWLSAKRSVLQLERLTFKVILKLLSECVSGDCDCSSPSWNGLLCSSLEEAAWRIIDTVSSPKCCSDLLEMLRNMSKDPILILSKHTLMTEYRCWLLLEAISSGSANIDGLSTRIVTLLEKTNSVTEFAHLLKLACSGASPELEKLAGCGKAPRPSTFGAAENGLMATMDNPMSCSTTSTVPDFLSGFSSDCSTSTPSMSPSREASLSSTRSGSLSPPTKRLKTGSPLRTSPLSIDGWPVLSD